MNRPIWHGKIMELSTFHDIGKNFYFLSTEFRFLAWSLHFLSAEFWVIYLEQCLRVKLGFSECRI